MSYISTSILAKVTLIFLCSSMFVLSGCATSKSTKYFMLTPLAERQVVPGLRKPKENILSIGVGPISLPDYVNRPQIVTKNGENELVINDFYHWAEPLNTSVLRVLSGNLSILLGTENIYKYPWNRFVSIDYQVVVDIIRFDSVIDKDATLEARWVVLTNKGRNEILRKKSKITKKTETEQYDAIVITKNKALAELSQQIAHEIHILSKSPNTTQTQ